jgi:hypothetical protein
MPRGVRLTWGDLVSPRAVYEFTLADAWGEFPIILAMLGFFVGGIVVLFAIKKLLQYFLLRREWQQRLALIDKTRRGKEWRNTWARVPIYHAGTIWHLLLETLFVVGIVACALFAASVGGINIWLSAGGALALSVVGTYVFGPGLQQLGAGYYVLLTNSVCVGEYWEVVGTPVEGFVSRITPGFIELENGDPDKGTAVLYRVPMASVAGREMRRDFQKEMGTRHAFMDVDEVHRGPFGPESV